MNYYDQLIKNIKYVSRVTEWGNYYDRLERTGFCFGLTSMWVRAVILDTGGWEKRFKPRMEKLCSREFAAEFKQRYDLMKLSLKQVHPKVTGLNGTPKKDPSSENVNGIRAFLDGLLLYHLPRNAWRYEITLKDGFLGSVDLDKNDLDWLPTYQHDPNISLFLDPDEKSFAKPVVNQLSLFSEQDVQQSYDEPTSSLEDIHQPCDEGPAIVYSSVWYGSEKDNNAMIIELASICSNLQVRFAIAISSKTSNGRRHIIGLTKPISPSFCQNHEEDIFHIYDANIMFYSGKIVKTRIQKQLFRAINYCFGYDENKSHMPVAIELFVNKDKVEIVKLALKCSSRIQNMPWYGKFRDIRMIQLDVLGEAAFLACRIQNHKFIEEIPQEQWNLITKWRYEGLYNGHSLLSQALNLLGNSSCSMLDTLICKGGWTQDDLREAMGHLDMNDPKVVQCCWAKLNNK